MEFTEHEVSVMKGIADEETLALLKKIFVDMPSANYVELTKNIVGLDNEKYGELMKVVYLAKKDNLARIDIIKKATRTKTEGKASVHAPR
tara:strand:- start:65 stop:334 length:270 start_codon:yes stop_codon:yes gene_type:complete